jgi:hypothetical protein
VKLGQKEENKESEKARKREVGKEREERRSWGEKEIANRREKITFL